MSRKKVADASPRTMLLTLVVLASGTLGFLLGQSTGVDKNAAAVSPLPGSSLTVASNVEKRQPTNVTTYPVAAAVSESAGDQRMDKTRQIGTILDPESLQNPESEDYQSQIAIGDFMDPDMAGYSIEDDQIVSTGEFMDPDELGDNAL